MALLLKGFVKETGQDPRFLRFPESGRSLGFARCWCVLKETVQDLRFLRFPESGRSLGFQGFGHFWHYFSKVV